MKYLMHLGRKTDIMVVKDMVFTSYSNAGERYFDEAGFASYINGMVMFEPDDHTQIFVQQDGFIAGDCEGFCSACHGPVEGEWYENLVVSPCHFEELETVPFGDIMDQRELQDSRMVAAAEFKAELEREDKLL